MLPSCNLSLSLDCTWYSWIEFSPIYCWYYICRFTATCCVPVELQLVHTGHHASWHGALLFIAHPLTPGTRQSYPPRSVLLSAGDCTNKHRLGTSQQRTKRCGSAEEAEERWDALIKTKSRTCRTTSTQRFRNDAYALLRYSLRTLTLDNYFPPLVEDYQHFIVLSTFFSEHPGKWIYTFWLPRY